MALQAQPSHPHFCFDVLVAHLEGTEAPSSTPFVDWHCPLFVTWNKVSRSEYRLRGCIGTLEPQRLKTALQEYTLISALRDKRFAPIQRKELQSLQCTVSLLHSFEAAANWQQWSIGVHGLIIHFTDPLTRQHRTATFLPEIAAHEGWTHMEAIDSLVRKSGFSGSVTFALRDALRLTRYQSTAQSLTYQEWHDRRANAPGLANESVGQFPIPVVA